MDKGIEISNVECGNADDCLVPQSGLVFQWGRQVSDNISLSVLNTIRMTLDRLLDDIIKRLLHGSRRLRLRIITRVHSRDSVFEDGSLKKADSIHIINEMLEFKKLYQSEPDKGPRQIDEKEKTAKFMQ